MGNAAGDVRGDTAGNAAVDVPGLAPAQASPRSSLADLARETRHDAIRAEISILRGMLAPPLGERLPARRYRAAMQLAAGQPEAGSTEQAGVGMHLPPRPTHAISLTSLTLLAHTLSSLGEYTLSAHTTW